VIRLAALSPRGPRTASTSSLDGSPEKSLALFTFSERHLPRVFVDATSFALMRKLRMREALAFGGDFAAAGFVELRP